MPGSHRTQPQQYDPNLSAGYSILRPLEASTPNPPRVSFKADLAPSRRSNPPSRSLNIDDMGPPDSGSRNPRPGPSHRHSRHLRPERPSSSQGRVSREVSPSRAGLYIPYPSNADSRAIETLAFQIAALQMQLRNSQERNPFPLERPTGLDPGDPYISLPQWSAGDDYGPVLSPSILPLAKVRLQINPVLRPLSADRSHILWNMMYPSSYAYAIPPPSTEPIMASIPLESFESQPATFPRVSSIQISSRSFPWVISVSPQRPKVGVTCGDVINSIHASLSLAITIADLGTLPRGYMSRLKKAFYARDANMPDHLQDSDGMKRIDWLLEDMFFSGLVQKTESDPEHFDLLCRPAPRNDMVENVEIGAS